MLKASAIEADPARALGELGFRRHRPGLYSTRGVTLTVRGGWLTVVTARPRKAPPGGDLGRPGLWMTGVGGRTACRVFELPLDPLLGTAADDYDERAPGDVVAAAARWALETRSGRPRRSWTAPPAERVRAAAGTQTLRAGRHLEPVRVTCQKRTVALRATMGRIDGSISEPRRRWLEQLLADAGRLRMVRVGVAPNAGGPSMFEAEVNLSGAPPWMAEALLPVAVEALRRCFSWLAPTAALIGDPQIKSVALETEPLPTPF